jgi:bifunctional non-homologous end joining protein LigD
MTDKAGGGLREYRAKRDFRRTPEPAAGGTPRKRAAQTGGPVRRRTHGPRFVVHEHHARRLHWDLRLEHDGALMSWAVPNGIPQDPSENRKAIHVEDHPLSYLDFEGEIPAGSYGAGRVVIWDRGWWEPDGDPRAGYRKGSLKFTLHGRRLRGGWALVRMRPRDEQRRAKENWLLIKERDAAVTPRSRTPRPAR